MVTGYPALSYDTIMYARYSFLVGGVGALLSLYWQQPIEVQGIDLLKHLSTLIAVVKTHFRK